MLTKGTNNVVLALNSLEEDTWERFEDVGNVIDFLQTKFNVFPDNARIYHECVAGQKDVTPWDEASIAYLLSLEGTFYVVNYPEGAVAIIEIVLAVVAVAAAIFLRPQIPTLSNRNQSSSNNELSNRTNKVRLGSRIPSIYGTVSATPDLLSSYSVYENNIEVEYAYMCLGSGYYTIDPSQIYDDATAVAHVSLSTTVINIPGTSVCIYDPYTSPNSGMPRITVGTYIPDPVLMASRSTSVNGQVLRPPNINTVVGVNNIYFTYPNVVTIGDSTSALDFTAFFNVGDSVAITNANYAGAATKPENIRFEASTNTVRFFSGSVPGGLLVGSNITIDLAVFSASGDAFDLSGTYLIDAVNTDNIVLDNPIAVNPQWNNLASDFSSGISTYKVCNITAMFSGGSTDLSGTYTIVSVAPHVITLNNPVSVNAAWGGFTGNTPTISPTLATTGQTWIGPFIVSPTAVGTSTVNIEQIWGNFIAINGLYKDDGSNQYAAVCTIHLEITPLDGSGNPVGAATFQDILLTGSSIVRSQVAGTLKYVCPQPAVSFSVRAARATNTDTTFKGNVVDEIQWRDLTAIIPIPQANFGNVTTVHSVTQATTGALAVKDRKLNMIVTRNLPQYLGNSIFSTTLYPTTNAADIMSAVCLDPVIGNRTVAEVDFDSIYNTVGSVANYFGTTLCTDFCYTFDSDNLSFEETLATIAHTVFCTAYRRGSKIKLSFEQQTEQSTMLFNHRNKVPNSETRSVRFGIEKDYDGVEYTWVSPLDNSTQTFYIPADMSAISPEKIQSQGVRNGTQASMQANRIWNKLKYQNVTVEFEGLQESDLLLLNDRIQLTDSTRVGTQDGEVLGQSGLTLNLSQPLTLTDVAGLTIFLQYYDESVESIPVYATSDPYSVILSRAPRMPLYLDIDACVRTGYIITGNSSKTPSAYLVQDRTPQAKMTNKITCINYDDRYYQNDQDYADGLIDLAGLAVTQLTTESGVGLATESGTFYIKE